jgi:hypothetical protein
VAGAIAAADRAEEEADSVASLAKEEADAVWALVSDHCSREAEAAKADADEERRKENQEKLLVTWEQYGKRTVCARNGQQTDKVVLMETSATPSEFVQSFESTLRKYAEHKFIAVSQTARRALLKENLPKDAIMLEMDFSENYEMIHRVEMQSEYFGHQQVTLFMVITHWLGSDGELHSEAHVFLSSDKDHDTFFVQHVLSFFAKLFKDKRFRRWYMDTDGAASHFKNRFTMRFWCEIKKLLDELANEVRGKEEASGESDSEDGSGDAGVLCMWETCAPGHGKGPWDGLGAAIKTWIRRQELHAEGKANGKTVEANSPLGIFKLLCRFAAQWQKGVRSRCTIGAWRVYFIPTTEDPLDLKASPGTILAPISRPDPRPKVTPLAGIRSHFCFRVINENTMKMRRLSCHCEHCRRQEWDACTNQEFGAWTTVQLLKSEGGSRAVTRFNKKQELDKKRRDLARKARVGEFIALESANDDWNSWWLAKVTVACFKFTGKSKAVDSDGLRMQKGGYYLKVRIYSRTTVTSSCQFVLEEEEERTFDAEGVVYTDMDVKARTVNEMIDEEELTGADAVTRTAAATARKTY